MNVLDLKAGLIVVTEHHIQASEKLLGLAVLQRYKGAKLNPIIDCCEHHNPLDIHQVHIQSKIWKLFQLCGKVNRMINHNWRGMSSSFPLQRCSIRTKDILHQSYIMHGDLAVAEHVGTD